MFSYSFIARLLNLATVNLKTEFVCTILSSFNTNEKNIEPLPFPVNLGCIPIPTSIAGSVYAPTSLPIGTWAEGPLQ